MEKWRRVWRAGLAPHLSRAGLLALQSSLLRDDPRLLQGTVSSPPPLDALRECAVNGACAISWCGWQGQGLRSVGQVEEYFHRTCDAAAAALQERPRADISSTGTTPPAAPRCANSCWRK